MSRFSAMPERRMHRLIDAGGQVMARGKRMSCLKAARKIRFDDYEIKLTLQRYDGAAWVTLPDAP